MKVSEFHKNFITLLSGNGIALIIPLVFAPVVSRLYTPVNFGEYAIFASILSILTITCCGRYEQAFVLPADEQTALRLMRLAHALMWRIFGVCCLLALPLAWAVRNWTEWPGEYYVLFLPIMVPVIGYYLIGYHWHNRLKAYRRQTMSKLIQSAVTTAVTLICGFLTFGTWGLIFATTIGFVIGGFIFYRPIRIGLHNPKGKEGVSTLLKELSQYNDFPRVNLINALIQSLNTEFIFFSVLARFYGMQMLGQFSFANRYIRAPLKVMNSAISHVFYKEAAVEWSSGRSFTRLFDRTLITVTSVAFPICGILLVFGPGLFSFIFGEEWRLAGRFAQILAPLLFLNFLTSSVTHITNVVEKQKDYFILNSIEHLAALLALAVVYLQGGEVSMAIIAYVITASLFQIFKLFWFRRMSSI